MGTEDMTLPTSATSEVALVEERKRWAYVPAALLVIVGFCIDLFVYTEGSRVHYALSKMQGGPMALMWAGTAAEAAGLALGWWSLFPPLHEIKRRKTPNLELRARDSQQLKWSHWLVVAGMVIAIAIDFMKPITVGFVLPGFKNEYHLTAAQAASLAFFGIGGTAIASVFWGWLADRTGRRSALMFTSLVFIATSGCGAMMPWQMNVIYCFIMGLASGGLLPVALAYLAEILPSWHRGWLLVIIGGELGLAYAASSWLATWLTPHYTWRMLWLVGAPLGLFLAVLSYVVPESPRFLLTVGQTSKAHEVMRRYGMVSSPSSEVDRMAAAGTASALPRTATLASLFRRPLIGRTSALAMLGLSAGLINYGFLLWLPTNLSAHGVSVQSADRLLAHSSLVSLPAIFLVALLYNVWSSKGTAVFACCVTFAALVALVILVPKQNFLLEALIAVILSGNAALYATLGPYATEMYPTYLRSGGTGVAQGWGRIGGVIGPGLVVASITPPGLAATAIVALVPTALAAMGILGLTKETRRRRLEELGAD